MRYTLGCRQRWRIHRYKGIQFRLDWDPNRSSVIGQQNIGKQGLNPTGRSLPCSFHGFRVENVSLWMSQPLLCCWWTPESWRCRSKIERCIGTSCILYLPKVEHAILSNKDAPIDSSTRKMKGLHLVGRMRHYSSKTDTTDWCSLRRVSKW